MQQGRFDPYTYSIQVPRQPVIFYDALIPSAVYLEFPILRKIETLYESVGFVADEDCDDSCQLIEHLIRNDFAKYNLRVQGLKHDFSLKPIREYVDLNLDAVLMYNEEYCKLARCSHNPGLIKINFNYVMSLSVFTDTEARGYLATISPALNDLFYPTEGKVRFCYAVFDLYQSCSKLEPGRFYYEILRNRKCTNHTGALDVVGFEFGSSMLCHMVQYWDASAVCGIPIVSSLAKLFGGECAGADVEKIKEALRLQVKINNNTESRLARISDSVTLLMKNTDMVKNGLLEVRDISKQMYHDLSSIDNRVIEAFQKIYEIDRKLYRFEQVQYLYNRLNSYFLQFDRTVTQLVQYVSSDYGVNDITEAFGVSLGLETKISAMLKEIGTDYQVAFNHFVDVAIDIVVTGNDTIEVFVNGYLPVSLTANLDNRFGLRLEISNVFKTNGTHCVGGIADHDIITVFTNPAHYLYYDSINCFEYHSLLLCNNPLGEKINIDRSKLVGIRPCGYWNTSPMRGINSTHIFIQNATDENGRFLSGLVITSPNGITLEEMVRKFQEEDIVVKYVIDDLGDIREIAFKDPDFSKLTKLTDDEVISALDNINNTFSEYDQNMRQIKENKEQFEKLQKEAHELNEEFSRKIEALKQLTPNGIFAYIALGLAILAIVISILGFIIKR